MGGRQPLKIPFSSKDPRYFKCWNLVRKQGLSVEEALVKMGEPPRPIVPPEIVSQVMDAPLEEKKPRAPAKRNGNGNKVTAEDLLGHPGVPEKVKKQLRGAQAGPLETLDAPPQEEKEDLAGVPVEREDPAPLRTSARSETVVPRGPPAFIPITLDEQIPSILAVLARIATSLEKPAGDSSETGQALNPHLARWLQRLCTDFEEQNKLLVNIATALELQLNSWNRLCNDLEAINNSLEALNKNMAHTRWSH